MQILSVFNIYIAKFLILETFHTHSGQPSCGALHYTGVIIIPTLLMTQRPNIFFLVVLLNDQRYHGDNEIVEKELFRWYSSVLPRNSKQVITQELSQQLQVTNITAAVNDEGVDYKVYFNAKIGPFKGYL